MTTHPDENRHRRALVFSGDSFVGRHVCRALQESGAEITATSFFEQCCDLRCDVTLPETVREAMRACRPEWIVQCTGATGTSDPSEMYAIHVMGTLHVLQAAKEFAPGASVVLFGSAAEYGKVPVEMLPVSEDCDCRPDSFFGASKLAQTQAARVATESWSLRAVTLRPFNVIGPGIPSVYFLGALGDRLIRLRGDGGNREMPVVNGRATRDLVDVRDVAQAVVMSLDWLGRQFPGCYDVLNVATGKETTILDLAERACQAAGWCRAVEGEQGPSRSGVTRSRGDASRLSSRIGWQPQISWEESVHDFWREKILTENAGKHRQLGTERTK